MFAHYVVTPSPKRVPKLPPPQRFGPLDILSSVAVLPASPASTVSIASPASIATPTKPKLGRPKSASPKSPPKPRTPVINAKCECPAHWGKKGTPIQLHTCRKCFLGDLAKLMEDPSLHDWSRAGYLNLKYRNYFCGPCTLEAMKSKDFSKISFGKACKNGHGAYSRLRSCVHQKRFTDCKKCKEPRAGTSSRRRKPATTTESTAAMDKYVEDLLKRANDMEVEMIQTNATSFVQVPVVQAPVSTTIHVVQAVPLDTAITYAALILGEAAQPQVDQPEEEATGFTTESDSDEWVIDEGESDEE